MLGYLLTEYKFHVMCIIPCALFTVRFACLTQLWMSSFQFV